MSQRAFTKTSRLVSRTLQSSRAIRPIYISRLPKPSLPSIRKFSICAPRLGVMPTDGPNKAASSHGSFAIAELSDSEYHELADEYLETVLTKFENLQETREDLDVEFSSGVMTLTLPGNRIYVINKQPPNKQIWLSSPTSGPKRYDWCTVSDGQGEKEGGGHGAWVYARDKSKMDDLLLEEIGIDVSSASD